MSKPKQTYKDHQQLLRKQMKEQKHAQVLYLYPEEENGNQKICSFSSTTILKSRIGVCYTLYSRKARFLKEKSFLSVHCSTTPEFSKQNLSQRFFVYFTFHKLFLLSKVVSRQYQYTLDTNDNFCSVFLKIINVFPSSKSSSHCLLKC